MCYSCVLTESDDARRSCVSMYIRCFLKLGLLHSQACMHVVNLSAGLLIIELAFDHFQKLEAA